MRSFGLALLIAMAFASPARGDVYPGQRPAGPTTVRVAGMAEAFWAQRDVIGCPDGITVLVANDLTGGDGGAFGRGGNCAVWIWDFVAAPLERRHSPNASLAFACMTIYHEVGHALGLPHSATGLMSVTPSTPWDCRVFARAHDDHRLEAKHWTRVYR